MNDFIEAMIREHDKTKYRWISGKCRDKCFVCDSNNNRIETMQDWQAKGLQRVLKRTKFHDCSDNCTCTLEIAKKGAFSVLLRINHSQILV